MNIFTLPDLGEGLPDAELLQWQVAEGDRVAADQNLLSVETAKAVLDIPSPVSGLILKLFGEPGDIIQVGDPLVEFDEEDAADARDVQTQPIAQDAGSVVGRVATKASVLRETNITGFRPGAGVKATPAVRALARRMEVDLAVVTPSGAGGVITAGDVQRVAKTLREVGPLEPLRGVRRAMALAMTRAHTEVVPVTVSDDADIQHWSTEQDIMLRLIRALVVGCRAEPSLNAWYDSHSVGRRLIKSVHLGIAVDTAEGLFVPVLRNVDECSVDDLRSGLENLKQAVRSRRIPPDDLRGNTITLSNFGVFGGRYANPVVIPPTVAILGAGRIRDDVVALAGQPVVHRIIPVSLTFDHRAVTGGEATRFLTQVIEDLMRAD